MPSSEIERRQPEDGPSSRIVAIGVNHRAAPIAARERLSIPPAELPEVLRRIRAVEDSKEVVALSTCNRVELYISLDHGDEALDRLVSAFCEVRGVPRSEVEPFLCRFEDLAAVGHLFEVASGLDSMVPGENQILAQVKAAYSSAVDAGAAGPVLARLFQKAFKVAKDVRSTTGISRRNLSIATVVVDLSRKVFAPLDGTGVVVAGAGKMGRLTLGALVSEGARVVAVANRSRTVAEELVAEYGGEGVALDEMGRHLARADIFVASTASPETILSAETVKRAARARKGSPILLVDLGVPRNIDPAAGSLAGVILYNVDDLQGVVASNVAYRLEQAERARAMIEQEVQRFAALLRTDELSATIAGLCGALRQIGETEFRRTSNRLGDLTPEQLDEVRQMARRIVGKIQHMPVNALKEEARSGNGVEIERVVKRLFGIWGGHRRGQRD